MAELVRGPQPAVFVVRGHLPRQLGDGADSWSRSRGTICAPPFASLVQNSSSTSRPCSSSAAAGSSPQLLWQLSRGSSSEAGTEGENSADSSASGSSPLSSDCDDGDLDSSELELFSQASCPLCRKDLLPSQKRRWWWPWGSSSSRALRRHMRRAPPFIVCDGCQGCFHERCCEQRGIPIDEDHRGWYHSSDCRQCRKLLQQYAAKGPVALGQQHTLELLDTRSKEKAGSAAATRLKQGLGDSLEVLVTLFGPGVAQQMTGSNYVVLLRHQQQPVTAGLLDVYGQSVAVLDCVGTDVDAQGRGHCSALLGGLGQVLGAGLGVASLVAVMDQEDKEMQQVWQKKFQFQRLGKRQVQLLGSQLPLVAGYQQSVLLSKGLPRQVPGALEALWSEGSTGQQQRLQPDESDSELVVVPLQLDAPPTGAAAAQGGVGSR